MRFVNSFVLVVVFLLMSSGVALSESNNVINPPEDFYNKASVIQHYDLESPDRDLYILATLTCPACKKYFKILDSSDMLKKNNIQVNWVILPTSVQQKAILAGLYKEGNIEALRNSYSGETPSPERGGRYMKMVDGNSSVLSFFPKSKRRVPMNLAVDVKTNELTWGSGLFEKDRLEVLADYLLNGEE